MERDLREEHRKATNAEAGKLIADAHAKASAMIAKLEMELIHK